MSLFTRIRRRLLPNHFERDLREEIAFHLESRIDQLMQAGSTREAATEQARHQFGDVEAALRGMRRARVVSISALAATSMALTLAALLIARQFAGTTDSQLPAFPPRPPFNDPNRPPGVRPPPPPPPPTWEQFVKQVNTFGNGVGRK